ncbi:MAG: 1,4-dihydroxy-2-naphthoate octaprenyltransferase [Schleiferiaceae bacterium]|jgi:1,4-dihydroxy-2-naphthoate octaprenyltransferase|nr:1,4-dihydroxy-2-naphthoate octaprenyltransferase [Schleiferiaceae bacterium]MDB4346786.1 1,4-dihydroxy-2-naphthoate octaprenyltransferase [bacterium]PTM18207.1 MAG: 1,4-dihydroxy-2-naphthoate octaprenyltransferase [Bacteroidota bacterium]HAR21712.1 1,4-dihydroxy-2-naphthoate octaprenyltransferase [Cryomorphaceae bacterium]MDA8769803.1 1,4-dihydroxy-2-naphthoate octaprenyltransferase [Schleiferiaceae bacterium]
MVPLHIWIQAARLRTLPLAFAVIALGTGLAFKINEYLHWGIFALAVFTAGAYQILSNYANDLGDGLRGTDDHRTGEKRAIASGLITADQMKRAVNLWTVLALFGGGGLSFLAFQERIPLLVLFSLLNVAAVLAAKSYTMGPKPYAYWGGGDFFVFLFFGLVGVLGSANLYGTLHWSFLFPALVAGAYSAAVLTLNNLRDVETDAIAGKRTLVVRFGYKWGRGYFKALLIIGNVLSLLFALYWAALDGNQYLLLFHIAFGVLLSRVVFIRFARARDSLALDALLKPMALMTLLYCIGTALSLNL